MSHPSGLPDDDQPDDERPAARRRDSASARSTPRHMAASRRHRPWDDPEELGTSRSAYDTDPSGRPFDDVDDVDARGDDDEGSGSTGRFVRSLVEWVAVIGCGVLIALVAQAFLVQAFWIPSASMEPTLQVKDRVLVNKLAYDAHDVHRGDVIVFERPEAAFRGDDDDIKDLIKRVVAVSGDTLELHDGDVYVNGERIDEPYLVDGTPTLPASNGCPEGGASRWELEDGTVFVMGDNRTDSEDARCFGPIDEDLIVGRAVVKVLPLSDIGWL